jgi:hypothetical protein
MQGRDRKWDYSGERSTLDVILRSDLIYDSGSFPKNFRNALELKRRDSSTFVAVHKRPKQSASPQAYAARAVETITRSHVASLSLFSRLHSDVCAMHRESGIRLATV